MKKIFALLAISSNFFAAVYDELEELLPFNGQSLMAKENKSMLNLLIRTKNVGTIIEIGSWVGASTMFMAKRLPSNGKLYAIDTWKGCPEHAERSYAKDMLPTLYEQFLSNIIHKKLTDKIIPMRMTSLEGAEALRGQVKPDLIFIDGAHDEDSVYNDLCAWYPFIEKGGVICGDDWNWKQNSTGKQTVRAAVKRFAEERGITISTHGTFWYFL